jgi:hypothetical protein
MLSTQKLNSVRPKVPFVRIFAYGCRVFPSAAAAISATAQGFCQVFLLTACWIFLCRVLDSQ